MAKRPRIGLVLTGGGARGAYQAGTLRAVAEIASEIGIAQPFPIMTGLSAGAMNASYLAAYADDMLASTGRLVQIWNSLTTERVFRTSSFSLFRSGLKMLLEALSRGYLVRHGARGLLDTSPLRDLIDSAPLRNIRQHIARGAMDAIAVTAINYSDGSSKTFFDSREYVEPWVRVRRWSEKTQITTDHIMASTAIPFLFPPSQVGDCSYGDGGVRNHAPLSPAIRLGAEKLIVVSVRRAERGHGDDEVSQPSMGRVLSVLLNSILLDAVDVDAERLQRINQTLRHVSPGTDLSLRPIEMLMLRPSEDIGKLAFQEAYTMPRGPRYLIGGLGSEKDSAGLISYLLFETPYLQRLCTMGYRDTLARKDEVAQFLITP